MTEITIALLIATNLAACLMAWWAYRGKREWKKLAQHRSHVALEWQWQLLHAKCELRGITAQRREAGRKGGLATARTKAMIKLARLGQEFDAAEDYPAAIYNSSTRVGTKLDYPAALDRARRT